MASTSRPESARNETRIFTSTPAISSEEASLKARLSRKRTKTGCLTCRKRRIKCGEERPVCRNCIKSKRQCEGYTQRVIFREPSVDYRPVHHGGAHITFQAGALPGPVTAYHQEFSQSVGDRSFYSHSTSFEQYPNGVGGGGQRYFPVDQYAPNGTHVVHAPPTTTAFHPGFTLPSNGPAPQSAGGHIGALHAIDGQTATANHVPHVQTQAYAVPQDQTIKPTQPVVPGESQVNYQALWQYPYAPNQGAQWQATSLKTDAQVDRVSPLTTAPPKAAPWAPPVVPDHGPPGWATRAYVPRPELTRPIDYQPPSATPDYSARVVHTSGAPAVQSYDQLTPEFYEHEEHPPSNNTPTHILRQAAVEAHDDDYYDVESDEEMVIDTLAVTSVHYERQRDLQRSLRLNKIGLHESSARRSDSFIYEGILDHYRVEDAANPLRNPATARVFAHFISVTGPTLSIFERHPRNASVLFSEGEIPFSQQGLWTYTMPMMALRHQGLLHAMLAVASLHIARLQDASDSPSRQHYGWAIKRIHRSVGNKKSRFKLNTIAATMLLGFYEIMTADHSKWNMHLAGSKQLFSETDFATMTRQFRSMKFGRATRENFAQQQSTASPNQSQDEILDQIPDVDERIISDLVGKEIRYDDYGRIVTTTIGMPPELDLRNFEILKDLYWWYLKQDVYQSIISGNPLLLNYDRWANCPPRAPLGKADAVYGSFDHLILLLGRIADFAARDRRRKLMQMEANGGIWRPHSGVNIPTAPVQQQQSPTVGSVPNGFAFTGAGVPPVQPQGPPPPQFFGMVPPPRENVQMPAPYYPTESVSSSQTGSPPRTIDLQSATQAALAEYQGIQAALHLFSTSLGKNFEALSPEYQPPLETPWGRALSYRSYDIGCLWAVYNMAMIIAIRSHPHMHPAAHAAAAITAQDTSFFANEIGRITAGIVPGPPDQPLNPILGASLAESCMPSFFAAIQYKDAHQRHATVMRIYNIALRTGWGSAELIANGCETAWVKAAAAGRGPPYTRVIRPENSDDPRLNGSWETLDPYAVPDEKDEGDRRLVRMKEKARLTWAIGVLGMEDDENLALAS